MRDYAKVAPQFWTGRTGKALKAAGPEAVIVGMYLMTSPHANMIGVYHCPLAYISIDTGLTFEGATKGLQSAIEADFCTFDADSDYVFVHEFAAYQIGDELDPKDLRCKGVKNELAKVPKGQCWQGFRARYAVPFNLPIEAQKAPEKASPLQAPSKPEAGAGEEAGEGAEEKRAPRKRAPASQSVSVSDLVAEGVDAQHAADWIAARRVKHLPLTPTAWDATKEEVMKAGMTVPDAIRLAASNGWGGFKASWVDGGGRGSAVGKQAGVEARNAAVLAKFIKEHVDAIE